MSCMNFEQAYSGQIISGGIRPYGFDYTSIMKELL